MVRHVLHPWYLARDRSKRPEGHTFLHQPARVNHPIHPLFDASIHTSLKYTFIRSNWRSEVPW